MRKYSQSCTAERPRQIQLAFRNFGRLASFFAVVVLLARRERKENYFFSKGGGGGGGSMNALKCQG